MTRCEKCGAILPDYATPVKEDAKFKIYSCKACGSEIKVSKPKEDKPQVQDPDQK